MHGSQEAVNGTIADLAAVVNAFVDRFPEVESNEKARAAVLLPGLGEAAVRTEDRRRIVAYAPAGSVQLYVVKRCGVPKNRFKTCDAAPPSTECADS